MGYESMLHSILHEKRTGYIKINDIKINQIWKRWYNTSYLCVTIYFSRGLLAKLYYVKIPHDLLVIIFRWQLAEGLTITKCYLCDNSKHYLEESKVSSRQRTLNQDYFDLLTCLKERERDTCMSPVPLHPTVYEWLWRTAKWLHFMNNRQWESHNN